MIKVKTIFLSMVVTVMIDYVADSDAGKGYVETHFVPRRREFLLKS